MSHSWGLRQQRCGRAARRPRKLHLVDPWRTKPDGTLFDGPAQKFETVDEAADSQER